MRVCQFFRTRISTGCLVGMLTLGAVLPGMAGAVAATTEQATSSGISLPLNGSLTATEIGNGVWWTPELSETSITLALDNLTSWSISNLYVDVFRNGQTLFKSDRFDQRTTATGRDWLGLIITEAHRRNIRVHAWVQTLRWRDADAAATPTLLMKHPDWLEVAADTSPVDESTTAIYLCPGNPDVRAALAELVHEIGQYPIDGICLDALEYNPRIESGYNAQVRQIFRQEYEADPNALKRNPEEDSLWMKWVAMREDNLTSIVQQISTYTRELSEKQKRRILLTATVFPGYNETRGISRRYQNWRFWINERLVDATLPQCFNPQMAELEQQLWQVRSNHLGTRVACIPGLALSREGEQPHPALADQKRLLLNAGFQHCTVLDYHSLLEAMQAPAAETARKGFWSFLKDEF